MFKLKLLALTAILTLSMTSTSLAVRRYVWIVNHTSVTMNEFYASNTKAEDWEEDILGDDVLEPGHKTRIDIDDGSGACLFDFKAVFEDGSAPVKHAVNVCRISSFTYSD